MTARRVGHHVELEEEEARAGQTGLHMRYVLVFSTILAMLGIGIASLLS